MFKEIRSRLSSRLVNPDHLSPRVKLIILVPLATLMGLFLAIMLNTLSQMDWQRLIANCGVHTPGVFIYELFMLTSGVALSWFYLVNRRKRRAWFWLGNLGWLTAISAGGALLTNTFGDLTRLPVKQAIMWTTLSNYLLEGLIIILAGCAVWLNRAWYSKNHWYLFAVLAPYLVVEFVVFQTIVNWNLFRDINAYEIVAAEVMFVPSKHPHGHIDLAQFDLAQLSYVLQQHEWLTVMIGGLFLIYGSIGIVWKVNEKLKKG